MRKKFKIIGSFIGSPSYLGSSYQNKIHGLPLQLMIEEFLYLLTECCDKIKLVKQNLNENENLIARCVEEFKEHEDQFLIAYKQLDHFNSIEQIKKRLDAIVEGKAKKKQLTIGQLDKDQILNDEIEKIKLIKQNKQPKQMLIESPYANSFKVIANENELRNELRHLDEFEDSLAFKNEHYLLRYLVYKDLNKLGLYLTKGNKFGSDFLAYSTDPLFCHASYLVVCLSNNQKLTKQLLHVYTRLGTQVNKHVLLVRFKQDKEENEIKNDRFNNLHKGLEYMVIKWQSDI